MSTPPVLEAALSKLVRARLVILGAGVTIEPGVELCHATRAGERRPVVIGDGCWIRSGTVIYSGVRLGDRTQTGHHVMVRETPLTCWWRITSSLVPAS
jgi:acetyltransferase-like isoleucine patch superfamily enzyme